MQAETERGASQAGGPQPERVSRNVRNPFPTVFDAVVIGTGFGGAVTIYRLAQLGKRVLVLERGRRYDLQSLPDLPGEGQRFPDPNRWTWRGSQGLWDVRNLDGVTVAQAAGYGGGSLVYANVHLRPPREIFDSAWPSDCCQRAGLDEYYDLVGYMLDIQPVPKEWRTSGKVEVMARAFNDTAHGVPPGGGSPQVEHNNVFFPPLAIKFPRPALPDQPPLPAEPPFQVKLEANRHGALQGECVRCGGCDFGCRYGAKNTLDRNYLHAAEQCVLPGTDGEPAVTVRTLCEALYISPGPKSECYIVTYRDHLLGTVQEVAATYVFLCAGSVNTTELLLRSTDRNRDELKSLFDTRLRRGLPRKIDGLGERYYVNADALAGVFGATRPTFETAGPVITTALVYNEGADAPKRAAGSRPDTSERSWFLIEDGGYPLPAAPFFAALQSPLLLGRNRFGPAELPPFPLTAVRKPGEPRPDRYSSLLDATAAALTDGCLPDLLPVGLRTAFQTLRKVSTESRDDEVRMLAAAIRDEIILEIGLFRWFKRLGVDRWWPSLWSLSYRLLVRFARVDDDRLLARTLGAASYRYGTDDPGSLPGRAAGLLIRQPYAVNPPRAAFPRRNGGAAKPSPAPTPEASHQAVLLAMGRDDVPAALSLDAHQNLVARFPHGGFPTLAAEERVMRSIADHLGGTLYNTPLWAFARQPVTVHSHGGCVLLNATDAWGQLCEYPNLFVNDGSLLPRPVGVNPSSTIAALAERNMAHFATDVLGVTLPEAWDKDIKDAKAWAKRQNDEKVDLAPPEADPIELPHPAVGLKFAEEMRGYILPLGPPQALSLPTSPIERVRLAPFLRAEGDARARNLAIDLNLTATVGDIGAFLDDPYHEIELSGTVVLRHSGSEQEEICFTVLGTLSLLVNMAPGRKVMLYELQFDAQGDSFTLVGEKEIQEDPGFDAWLDSSTLYVELCEGTFEKRAVVDAWVAKTRANLPSRATGRGILRLGIRDFAINQLKQLQAIGTEDPERVIWTLGSFGVFFFGEMQGAYAPEIERFLSLFGRSSWHSATTQASARVEDSAHLWKLQGL